MFKIFKRKPKRETSAAWLKALQDEFEAWNLETEEDGPIHDALYKIEDGFSDLGEATYNAGTLAVEKQRVEMASFLWAEIMADAGFSIGGAPPGTIVFYSNMPSDAEGATKGDCFRRTLNLVELVELELEMSDGKDRNYWGRWADEAEKCALIIRQYLGNKGKPKKGPLNCRTLTPSEMLEVIAEAHEENLRDWFTGDKAAPPTGPEVKHFLEGTIARARAGLNGQGR